MYLLIHAVEGIDAKPSVLVAMPPDGPPVRVALPEDIDGVYQLIAREDSALVRAVRDPDSRLALR